MSCLWEALGSQRQDIHSLGVDEPGCSHLRCIRYDPDASERRSGSPGWECRVRGSSLPAWCRCLVSGHPAGNTLSVPWWQSMVPLLVSLGETHAPPISFFRTIEMESVQDCG